MRSRREVILTAAGLVAGAGALAACGKDEESGLNVLVVTPEVLAGQDQRLALVLQDDAKEYVAPKRATVRFGSSPDRFETPSAAAIVHRDAAPAPAYLTVPVRLSPAGTVFVEVTADGRRAVAPVRLVDALAGPVVGRALPSVATPTTIDLAGVSTLCTRQPACPLHGTSLDTALLAGRPLVVLVATPAFCQTAACGPVLDILLGALPAGPSAPMAIHLEVYAERPKGSEITRTPVAPAVKAFGLTSEPMLFVVGADGKVTRRIEGLFGRAEVTEALASIS